MYNYLAFKDATNSMLLKGPQKAIVMCKYLAFKGAPNNHFNVYVPCFQWPTNYNVEVLCFQRSPNSNFVGNFLLLLLRCKNC